MSDDCNRTPFWQRQPVLPLEVQRFLRARLEAALEEQVNLVNAEVLAKDRGISGASIRPSVVT